MKVQETNMTTQDKLKVLVQAAIDVGYEFLYDPTGNELDYLTIYINAKNEPDGYDPVEINLTGTEADEVTGAYISLADFILNREAMQAIFKNAEWEWEHYALKAAEIMLNGGDPIDYLYGEYIKLKGANE